MGRYLDSATVIYSEKNWQHMATQEAKGKRLLWIERKYSMDQEEQFSRKQNYYNKYPDYNHPLLKSPWGFEIGC